MSPATFSDRQHFRATLATIAARAKAKLPQCNSRVEKAVVLVSNNDIDYHAAHSSATVHSCADATKVYHVRGTVCDCPDYERAPQHLCKHVLGVMFLFRLQQVLPTETPQSQRHNSMVRRSQKPPPASILRPWSANVRCKGPSEVRTKHNSSSGSRPC